MQTGSGRSLREVGCSFQVVPKSVVVATLLNCPLLSRILSISVPGVVSTTWLSVVLDLGAAVLDCQLTPWSLLKIILAFGTPAASQNWEGNTSVPSDIAIPEPGPWKNNFQAGFLTCGVMLIGCDQVRPSSELLTRTYWPVSSGVSPGPEPAIERLPLLQRAATQIFLVTGSKRIQGSPMPLFSCGGPISMMIFMGDQVLPPSVLRFIPTSILPGRSRLLL